MAVLVFPSLLVYLWINNASIEIQEQVAGDFHRELVLQVEKTAKSLSPFNESAMNLGRLLSPLLGGNDHLHFLTIETEVSINHVSNFISLSLRHKFVSLVYSGGSGNVSSALNHSLSFTSFIYIIKWLVFLLL